jgi:hypothetical protein
MLIVQHHICVYSIRFNYEPILCCNDFKTILGNSFVLLMQYINIETVLQHKDVAQAHQWMTNSPYIGVQPLILDKFVSLHMVPCVLVFSNGFLKLHNIFMCFKLNMAPGGSNRAPMQLYHYQSLPMYSSDCLLLPMQP